MSSKLIIGIDLGALTAKIMLSNQSEYELVRTSHGSHCLPTAVSFAKGRARMIGEDSSEKGDENTVCMLDRLVECCSDEDPFVEFQRFVHNRENDSVYIPSMDEEYSSKALMAMLLGRIRRNAISTAERLGYESAEMAFVFAVPPNYSTEAREALTDAAFAASVSSSMCVDSPLAYGRVLQQRKFGDGEQKVMVVEIGHARTSISLLKIGDDGAVKDEEKKESHDEGITVLANVNSSILGAGIIDICLYKHFLSAHPSLAGSSFGNKSRSAQRLLDGCKKLKHLLSMLPEGKVTVESIGKNESDVNLCANRDLLVQLCEGPVIKQLKAMLEQCIEDAGCLQTLDELASVELTGGGSRIPFVQDVILECLGKQHSEFVFSKSLDDTSLALGAAMMGTFTPVPTDTASTEFSVERQEQRNALLKNEMAMSDNDREMSARDGLKNQIEAHILELRSARNSAHGSLLPTSEEFTALLDDTDDWLFSDECNEATLETMANKWTEVKSKTESLCAHYFNAKTEEAKRIELEMEEGAKQAAAERDAEAMLSGHDGEGDHDNRKLPTKRRMEIVMKNKDEGTELFGDGNYTFAAARYAKALSHCGKLFDLSPEDEEEVKKVKLSLHSNMALCYIKLEKHDNALQSCNEALALDPTNAKALFRRASVHHHHRKFDLAMKDLEKAEALSPDDKAVKKLKRLVDHEILKQKKKEQAMAKKMFG